MTYQEGLLGLLLIAASAGVATIFWSLGSWIWSAGRRVWWWILRESVAAKRLS